MNQFDVVVIGGGLAGACFARQLKMSRSDTSIAVIERSAFPLPEAAHKVGESTVEIGAHYFSAVLKLDSYLREQQLPKFGLRFFFQSADHGSMGQRVELGATRFLKVPSFQLDRGHLENHLRDVLIEQGVTFIDDAKVVSCELNAADRHTIAYTKNGERAQLQAKWVIDASGRWGVLKRKLGLAEKVGHGCSAAWWRIDARIDIDEWFGAGEDRFGERLISRWYSTNHLMGPGYWTWVIPLRGDRTSVGIVFDERLHDPKQLNSFEGALQWLTKHEPLCATACRERADLLMDYRLLRKFAHGCTQVFSTDRWGLTGEAGVFLDPFYSPGSDFIGIANTMLTDLVTRSLDGEDITVRTLVLNKVYKLLFANSLQSYEGMYPVFGNPLVMPTKIVWDYVVYWSCIAPLFFHNLLGDLNALMTFGPILDEVASLHREMQQLFLDWNERCPSVAARGGLDVCSNLFLCEINAALLEGPSLQGGAAVDFFRNAVRNLRHVAERIREMSHSSKVIKSSTDMLDGVERLIPFLQRIQGNVHDVA